MDEFFMVKDKDASRDTNLSVEKEKIRAEIINTYLDDVSGISKEINDGFKKIEKTKTLGGIGHEQH